MDFIAIVLDVGGHMYDSSSDSTSISLGINSVRGLIQKKLFSETKDELALILCGTLETKNNLNNYNIDDYKHIIITRELAQVNWQFLEDIDKIESHFESNKGDLLEAIIVAADYLVNKLKGRKVKGTKRVMVISNLEEKIDFSELDKIIDGLSKEDIELIVISDREFHDSDDNIDDMPSTSDGRRDLPSNQKLSQIRMTNEKNLSKIVSRSNGATYSFDDVLLSLNFFETKSTQARGWKANLELSNICQISLVGYIKVKQAKPQTLKLRYGGDSAAEVERRSTYHLKDNNNTAVELKDTIKGFRYGNSLVPCTEDDIKSMELTVEKGLRLIGFCDEENVSQSLFVGDSSMVFVADNPCSEAVFTSLVHAMYECNMVALVRRVYNSKSSPRLAVLSPIIKSKLVYLVYNEIAFGEDIRSYVFPSLPGSSVNIDVSDSANKKKTSTISESQLKAVDSFIDQLTLTSTNRDNNEDTELYKPSKTVSPFIQMFYQSASYKYFHPHDKLPDLNDHVMASLEPPDENREELESCIDAIKTLFPLRNKENNAKKKKPASDVVSQENGSSKKIKTDNDESYPLPFGDIMSSDVSEVGLVNPVDDFLDLLSQGKVSLAIDSMHNLIWKLINKSYLETLYPKAIVCLKELRKQVLKYSCSYSNLIGQFNEFLRHMKQSLLVDSSKITFWNLLKKENINLIGQSESDVGCADDDHQCFFDMTETVAPSTEQTVEEMDTLFEDM